jgi:hypothetical protein
LLFKVEITSLNTPQFIDVMILGSLVPVILIFGLISCLTILDIISSRSKEYILKYTKKMGLTEVNKLKVEADINKSN